VGDASGAEGGLDAYIAQGKVAVKLITLSCAGSCATVQAVGTGGSPPYSYIWENGTTNPVRQICPTADTGYSVSVTDTGESGELSRPSQTAKASVTADVLDCPDAGAVDAGSDSVVDAGSDSTGEEGPSCGDPGSSPWSGCVTAYAGIVGPDPTADAIDMFCGEQTLTSRAESVCLPKALLPGHSYSVTANYQDGTVTGPLPQSGVFASTGSCEVGPAVIPMQSWPLLPPPYYGIFSQSACFTADARYTHLVYREMDSTFTSVSSTAMSFQICAGCSGDR
jgi:hypothetical protein